MWSNQLIRIKNTMYYNTSLECWINLGDFLTGVQKLDDLPLKTLAIVLTLWTNLYDKDYEEEEILKDLENGLIKYNDDYVWMFDSIDHPTKSACCRIDDCILVGVHETLEAFGVHNELERWKYCKFINELYFDDNAYLNDLLN